MRTMLQARQKTRNKENAQQKEGYRRMLQMIASRRTQDRHVDIQEEELKALNIVRILVDGGWVCDRPLLETVLTNSGIQALVDGYEQEFAKSASVEKRFSERSLVVLQFAHNLCSVLGFPESIKLRP